MQCILCDSRNVSKEIWQYGSYSLVSLLYIQGWLCSKSGRDLANPAVSQGNIVLGSRTRSHVTWERHLVSVSWFANQRRRREWQQNMEEESEISNTGQEASQPTQDKGEALVTHWKLTALSFKTSPMRLAGDLYLDAVHLHVHNKATPRN